MHLTTPIYSYMQPGRCYGRQGEKVKVIAVHHQVAIVEAVDGRRFPAPVSELSEAPVEKSATQQVQVSDTTKAPKKTAKKKIITQQKSIFQ